MLGGPTYEDVAADIFCKHGAAIASCGELAACPNGLDREAREKGLPILECKIRAHCAVAFGCWTGPQGCIEDN